jgi:acetolactate synthase-1/2/3 large subunit
VLRVSDYIFSRLENWGVRHAFMIAGGGSMHLNEALRAHPGINYICSHHEQACAMAAEGYARVAGKPGVLCVTTGPGGINALNGVFGAYTDSVPMLVLSGQVKRSTCITCVGPVGARQLGYQEADIISMVRGITKYALLVENPADIRYHLEKAWHLATSGRPGPCWLDIPLDVQAAMVNPETMRGYDPAEEDPGLDPDWLQRQVAQVIDRMANAERPLILAGTGVRCADAIAEFQQAVQLLGAPVTTAHTHDTIATEDPLYCGRPGIFGQRAANFVLQNADALLVLGSSLHIRQVSYNWDTFAPRAFKIRVDIDPAELAKPLVAIDMPIECHLKPFLVEMIRQLRERRFDAASHADWLSWCRERVERYPVVQDHQRTATGPLNPYHFYESLFGRLAEDDVVICANGSAFIMPYQVGNVKDGQRLISNSGSASMGYDLPAAIGAAFARGGKRVICLSGDGSLQFNIQELQTIVHHHLPVKIFLLNNGGYRSIRATQMHFFGQPIGESVESGVSFPDFERIAGAYGLPYSAISDPQDLDRIEEALAGPEPAFCEVVVDPRQGYEPRVKSRELADGTIVSPNLEDMFPYLSQEELAENMEPSLVEVRMRPSASPVAR